MTSFYFVDSDARNSLDTLCTTLFDYKTKMGNTTINSCQENEIRERHNWAVNSLQSVEKVLYKHICPMIKNIHVL